MLSIPHHLPYPPPISTLFADEPKLLRISKTINDNVSTFYAVTYNGQNLLPATKQYGDEAPLIFEYNDRNEVVTVIRNGVPAYQKSFDSKSNAMVEKFEDGTVRIRKQASSGKRSEVLQFPDGTKQEKTYQDNELLSSVTTYQ